MNAKAARIRRSAEETRALVLQAARDELVESESQEIEVNRVARRCGLSEGLVYYHFTNRSGLLDALVRDHYAQLDARVSLMRFEGSTWVEREKARIEAMAALYYEDLSACLIASMVRADPKLQHFESERQQKLFRMGAKNISLAQADGEIPDSIDPYLLVSMLLAGSETGLLTAIQSRPKVSKKKAVKEIIEFVMRAAGVYGTVGNYESAHD